MINSFKQWIKPYYQKWLVFQEKRPVWATLIVHGGGAVIASLFLLWAIFNIFLPIYTRHGKSRQIPNVVNKRLPQAIEELEDKGLTVRLDSVYDEKKQPLTIIEQYPKAGYTYKKRNREVILTYNMSKPPLIELPDLKGRSLDIVKEQLKSLKLNIGNILYVPYSHVVFVEYQYKGKPVKAGQKIPQGETLDIVMGSGKCTKMLTPIFIGLSLEEAIQKAHIYGLEYEVDSTKYIPFADPTKIYSQSPGIRDSVCKGDKVIFVISSHTQKKKTKKY
ncbi:MAG: PASTA domain-containing protein [Bacteroidia bacterium]|nr:PASTA domain-containing protein [Bacteroidia bacterium]